MPLGQFPAPFHLAGRQNPHPPAFQGRLQDLPCFLRRIDNQHAALANHGYTLLGDWGRDILVPPEG
jgi:hypothetical protein